MVTALYTDEQTKYSFGGPVRTVALDPEYAVKKSRQFVCGGRDGLLILNSKGWLGNRDHVLHSGEGAVHAVRWRGSLIAWANDAGVKVRAATATPVPPTRLYPSVAHRCEMILCSSFRDLKSALRAKAWCANNETHLWSAEPQQGWPREGTESAIGGGLRR